MNRTNAKFVGGPLGGQSLQVDDLDTYRAIDPETGQEVMYRRHLYASPKGPELSTTVYVLADLSPEEANKQILQALPSRNRE